MLWGGLHIYITLQSGSKQRNGPHFSKTGGPSEDEMVRMPRHGPHGALVPIFYVAGWGEGEWLLVFKYTCIDNSKTVRLSYVC